jgi:hypothetical protein
MAYILLVHPNLHAFDPPYWRRTIFFFSLLPPSVFAKQPSEAECGVDAIHIVGVSSLHAFDPAYQLIDPPY